MCALLLACAACTTSAAQKTAPPAAADAAAEKPSVSSTVVVLGAPEPVTQATSARVVTVLNTKKHPWIVPTVEDYLRTDSAVYLQQRGSGGVQADVSLRGGSFDETLVLLNGFRINDSQTGHHDLDLPVPLAALATIDVLHGTGSTLYGADAMSGVIDFITAAPKRTALEVSAGGGSFGENEQSVLASLVRGPWSETATGSRSFSSGFTFDRDYRTEEASSEARHRSELGVTDLLLAGSDRAFGANQFYGDFPSWERTKGWFAALSQKLGPRTEAGFGYRRHADNFILVRADPALYANNHIDASWQAFARRKQELGRASGLFYGLDFAGDDIRSNNLGIHARNRGAGYADLDLHFGDRGALSIGAREELLSGGPIPVFSPSLSGSLFLGRKWKLRAAAGYGFRLPTYTDLYYSDPTTIGDPDLLPESAWSGEAGADWYANGKLNASVTVFYSRQHDAIDYIRANPDAIWRAANLSGVAFTGVEAAVDWRTADGESLKLSYASLYGAEEALHGLESEYIFNYPVENANAEWIGEAHGFALRNRVGVVERYQQTAYPVWDVALARDRGWVHPYVQLTNLSNTGYEEVEGVRMEGRAVVAGLELTLHHR